MDSGSYAISMWKKTWRFIKYILFIVGMVIIGLAISVYIYKDRIIDQLISEANKQINTPIEVLKIEIDLFKNFPQVSVLFSDVQVQESWPESTDPLLLAGKVFVSLNPVSLIKGNYEVNELHIENAEIFIRINSKGENNYTIFSPKKDGEISRDSSLLDLKKISLINTYIYYQDENNSQSHKYFTNEQEASFKLQEGMYFIKSQGDLQSKFIRIQGKDYAKNKNSFISTQMTYNQELKLLSFEPSSIEIRDSKYSLRGEVKAGDDTFVDLAIDGIDTNIQSLISLLPEDLSEQLNEYRSSGEVYFNMKLKGFTRRSVNVNVEFGLKNAELTHPKISSIAKGVFLEGNFHAASFAALDRSTLELTGVKGTFGSYPFSGKVVLNDLADPIAEIDLRGTFEMEELLQWIPESRIEKGAGVLHCQVSLSGRLKDLKSRYTSHKVKTSGEVRLDNVMLSFQQDFPLPTLIDGTFVFNQNDLAINNTSVKSGQSTWTMNGYFRNILPFLLFKNQYVGIEADINASFIDVAEILPTTSDEDADIQFTISPYLLLNFNCNVEELQYRRFKAKDLTGELKVKEEKIFAQNIEFNSMGGHLKFAGIINASGENINVTSSSHWEKLAIDSVFYVFNNFNQDWLVQENLKGNANADVLTDMTFSPELSFFPDSLVADISIAIIDGELNDFEPMILLEKYVEDENLAHLRFSELRNDIHVERKKIYLPQMEVRSNVSDILVSGSHTFNQEIDYRVVVPMKTLGKSRNEEMFGAVEDDGSGSKLHLKIIGTTENYEIKYDTEGVKNKVVSDLKKEVDELKNAFRKKEETIPEAILNEEEFFEWEEDTIQYRPPRL